MYIYIYIYREREREREREKKRERERERDILPFIRPTLQAKSKSTLTNPLLDLLSSQGGTLTWLFEID